MASVDGIDPLNAVVSDSIAITQQVEAGLSRIVAAKAASHGNSRLETISPPTSSDTSIDCLSLAQDSAALVKAHATKISLLIINEPYSATAITKVLRELITGPVPGLASAVQTCDPTRYTHTIHRDLYRKTQIVLRELRGLLERIPRDGKVLADAKKTGWAGAVGEKGSIAATGTLWAACDDLLTFSRRGLSGNVVQTVEQYQDTLKDVMEELKEWGEGVDEDQEAECDGEEEDVGRLSQTLEAARVSDSQAIVDECMNSPQSIPHDDPDKIRERLTSCLPRLRLTILLYQATVKRRLKKLPNTPPDPDSHITSHLDEIMSLLAQLPDRFSDLVLAFYDLEPAAIDSLMEQCFSDALAASELLLNAWQGEKDEFTDWVLRYQVEIRKG